MHRQVVGVLVLGLGLGLGSACGDDGDVGATAAGPASTTQSTQGTTGGDTPPTAGPDGGTTPGGDGTGGTGDGTGVTADDGPDDGPDDATDDGPDDTNDGTADPPGITLPPANAGLDYQLGGAYPPPAGVEVLSRDRTAAPADGLYNICYVNGYQTQPNEQQWWLDEHPDLLLQDGDGPFIDPDWDEILLDITTDAKRDAIAEIVGVWIDGCAADGYDAVEIDNLDTYARSDGLISQDDAVDFMSRLSSTAHAAGLAIAQKNSTEIADRQPEMGTDFAVAEECNRYDECGDYKAVYDDLVFVIEYREQDFDAGCANFPELSTVLRDLPLVPAGSGGYVFDGC